jgi:hypothetical protein
MEWGHRANAVRRWVIMLATLGLATLACSALVDRLGGGGGSASSPVSHQQALDTVISRLVEPGEPIIVFGVGNPLEPGDVIGPYHKDDLPADWEPITIESPTWFFWLEDAPGAHFAHATRFAFVTVDGGAVDVMGASWWPVLNGEGLWTESSDYWDQANWMYASQDIPSPRVGGSSFKHRPPGLLAAAEQGASPGRAIVINGWETGESGKDDFDADADQMHDILTDAGFDTTYLGPSEDGNPDRDGEPTASAQVDWFHRAANDMQPGETLFVFTTGHGAAENGVGMVGVSFEDILAGWLKGVKPGVHVVVVVNGCHSGAFVDGLRPVVDVVVTATDEEKPSYGDIDSDRDPNPDDRGSEFVSGFVDDWRRLMADPVAKQQVRDRARRQGRDFWAVLAAASHDSAKRKDLAFLRGWSSPQLAYGPAGLRIADEPTGTPSALSAFGQYLVDVVIKNDVSGHGDHIEMPDTLGVSLEPLDGGDVLIAGDPPWVDVEGSYDPSTGVIEATGSGTVAGYTGITVRFSGDVMSGTLTGDYTMGADGGLPTGQSITYGLEGGQTSGQ